MAFVALKPWDERPGEREQRRHARRQRRWARSAQIQAGARLLAQPTRDPGARRRERLHVQAAGSRRATATPALLAARNQMLGAASQSPLLAGVRPEGQEDAPQLRVHIDRIKARALGLSIGDVNATLAITFGSAYANDFSREGRILRVLLQADAPLSHDAAGRARPARCATRPARWCRSAPSPRSSGRPGAPQLQRYNGYPAMTISGDARAGPLDRRGDGRDGAARARAAAEASASNGPASPTRRSSRRGRSARCSACRWSSCSCCSPRCTRAGRCRWRCCSSCRSACSARCCLSMIARLSADVYFNVGLITIIGLVGEERDPDRRVRDRGGGARARATLEATMDAVKLRLRPIIMTSLAFILGMVPLVIATRRRRGEPHRGRHGRDGRHARRRRCSASSSSRCSTSRCVAGSSASAVAPSAA